MPDTVVHRCLRIDEILSNIVGHIPEGDEICLKGNIGWNIFSRSTLAALTRTCKGFHEISSSRLWAQDTLDHLLKCLPASCWSERTSSNSSGERSHTSVIIVSEVKEQDWSRFNYYANFIRLLYLGTPDVPDACLTLQTSLLALRDHHPKGHTTSNILPCLTAVHCDVHSASAVIGLVALLGTRVRIIRVPSEFLDSILHHGDEVPSSLAACDILSHYHLLVMPP